MGGGARALVFLLAVVLLAGTAAPDDSVADTCKSVSEDVQDCFLYVSGKNSKPSGECCIAADGINRKTPVCLCYVIQQVAQGTDAIFKSLDLNKVLSLSSLCNLINASVSACPGLLGIPPGAPENGIFNGTVYNKTDGGGDNGNGNGFAMRARYSYAFASAVFSAVALSVFSN